MVRVKVGDSRRSRLYRYFTGISTGVLKNVPYINAHESYKTGGNLRTCTIVLSSKRALTRETTSFFTVTLRFSFCP